MVTGLLRLFGRVKFSVVDVFGDKTRFSGATAWYPMLLKLMARTYFVRSIFVLIPVRKLLLLPHLNASLTCQPCPGFQGLGTRLSLKMV